MTAGSLGVIMGAAVTTSFSAAVLLFRRLPLILLMDWGNAAHMRPRVHSLVVLVMDALLLVAARRRTIAAAVAAAVAWLVVCAADRTYGFGMLHVEGWTRGVGEDVVAREALRDRLRDGDRAPDP
eukprot:gene7595-14931_t